MRSWAGASMPPRWLGSTGFSRAQFRTRSDRNSWRRRAGLPRDLDPTCHRRGFGYRSRVDAARVRFPRHSALAASARTRRRSVGGKARGSEPREPAPSTSVRVIGVVRRCQFPGRRFRVIACPPKPISRKVYKIAANAIDDVPLRTLPGPLLCPKGQLGVAFALGVLVVPECNVEQLSTERVFAVFGMGMRCVQRTPSSG